MTVFELFLTILDSVPIVLSSGTPKIMPVMARTLIKYRLLNLLSIAVAGLS